MVVDKEPVIGDVIVEQPTVLDIVANNSGVLQTDTNVYTVEMNPHTNDNTGETELLVHKEVVHGPLEEDLGMQMIYNPTNN